MLRGFFPNPLWNRERRKILRCIMDQFHHEMMAWGQNLIWCLTFCIWGPTVWERIQIGLAQIWCKSQQIWMLGTPRGKKYIHVAQREEYHRHLELVVQAVVCPHYLTTELECPVRVDVVWFFVRADVMACMGYKMGKGRGDWLGRGQSVSCIKYMVRTIVRVSHHGNYQSCKRHSG